MSSRSDNFANWTNSKCRCNPCFNSIVLCSYVSLRVTNCSCTRARFNVDRCMCACVCDYVVIQQKRTKKKPQNHLSHAIVFLFLVSSKKKFVFLLFLFLLTRFIYRILLCVSFGVCWCFPFTSEMFILFMRAHLSGTYHIHYVSTRVLSFSTPLLLKRTFKNGTAFGIFMEMYRLCISNSNQYIYIFRGH